MDFLWCKYAIAHLKVTSLSDSAFDAVFSLGPTLSYDREFWCTPLGDVFQGRDNPTTFDFQFQGSVSSDWVDPSLMCGVAFGDDDYDLPDEAASVMFFTIVKWNPQNVVLPRLALKVVGKDSLAIAKVDVVEVNVPSRYVDIDLDGPSSKELYLLSASDFGMEELCTLRVWNMGDKLIYKCGVQIPSHLHDVAQQVLSGLMRAKAPASGDSGYLVLLAEPDRTAKLEAHT
jgi:hypothetical protein